MRQSERATARRYLRLFRWLLTGILVLCLLFLLPHAVLACWHLYDRLVVAPKLGVIGSADTTTAIVTVSTAFPFWSWLLPAPAAAAAWRPRSSSGCAAEKRLRDGMPES